MDLLFAISSNKVCNWTFIIYYSPTFDSIVHLLMLIVTETPDCIFHFEDKKSKLTMKLHFGPEKTISNSGKGFKSKYSYIIYLFKAFL